MIPRCCPAWLWWSALVLILGSGATAWVLTRPGPVPAPSAPEVVAEKAPVALLPDEERKYLWEIEHHGWLLKKYGYKPLSNALRLADARALRAMLADPFEGQVLQDPAEVSFSSSYVKVGRREVVEGRPLRPVDRDAFVAQLLDYRRLFVLPPKVEMALMTLSPVTRGDLDGNWEGQCQLRMYGETAFDDQPQPEAVRAVTQLGLASGGWTRLLPPGAVGEVIVYLKHRVPRPTEKNLARPGWLQAATVREALVGRASHLLLKDVAAERGIDPRRFHDNWRDERKLTNTGGVFVCDFDHDGYLDVLITDVKRIALYKGLPGGKFRDVTTAVGLPTEPSDDSPVAAFVDLDGDGWEDLILGGRIYRNDEGRRFEDWTESTNLRIPSDAGGIVVADYDRDGLMDLYITRGGRGKASSWLDGTSGKAGGNLLWHNKGNWYFENVTARSGADGGRRSTFTSVWLDADNDGWPDLYVISEFGNGVLLVNNHDGTFRQQQLVEGPWDYGSMGLTAGDIDNDGQIDLYVGNMYSKAGSRIIGNLRPDTYPPEAMNQMRRLVTGSQLYMNRGGLRFESKGQEYRVAAVGWAYGPALVDLDNDGFLDLYATAGFVSNNRDEPDG
jgi:hypothetical protein